MTQRLRQLWHRHPVVREALLWAVPALLFGLLLRLCLLSYIPYAYWGSDSRSYFDFTYKLYDQHYFSLVEKRRFLYPIFIAVVHALPGSPLHWLGWIQHAFGLLAVLPIAYVIRKTCTFWRWWIIPLTILYTGMPLLLWYEHELLAETMMFSLAAWACGGWTAWALEERPERAARLWWWFLIPFACLILTKPAARFFWPGLGLGLLYLRAWRRMKLAGVLATIALMVITLFVGSKKHGAWLMYVATFPLTQLETPLHAEYKAQIADDVRKHRARIEHYFHEDEWVFAFLENPSKQTERPLWTKLESQPDLKPKIYKDLALEAIKANPGLFLMMGRDRLLGSANISDFKRARYNASYYPDRFANDYTHAGETIAQGRAAPEAMALGLPKRGPLPPYAEIREKLAPVHDGWAERFITGWIAGYATHGDLVAWPPGKERDQIGSMARPTLLGWYFLAAMAAAFTTRRYLRTHGVWVLAALSYLAGVFLLTQVNVRYFGAAWPALLPILVLPLDLLCSLVARLAKGRREDLQTPGPTT
ncbi:MAG TPA: hypothetical protein VGO11_00730 [Chthoniobacteraceae bacterium]|jgi:hypothetical protein|nr:hypothetical protein [Chthoniobacteraceae bacterium]